MLILTPSCTDRPGIVGAVGTFLAGQRCNILESAQFCDPDTGRFMMRVSFERLDGAPEEFVPARDAKRYPEAADVTIHLADGSMHRQFRGAATDIRSDERSRA